ncbi:MAG TPA: hypothetical protein VLA09_03125, partial [Longimicrobiales bacterium]|nr:hypothetical protein [Longimicrobiales bacterium]
MKARISKLAVGLALVGSVGSVPQVRSGGSEVPCAVPLTWRLARVDEEFGLSPERATAILREAAGMWGSSDGRPLFTHEPSGGFPIRLVYDARQERTDERAQREAELVSERRRLDREGDELIAWGRRHAAARAAQTQRQQDLERRVQEHNENVRMWNERGG